MKQQSFSSLEQAHKKKRTKREVFLAEMEAVVPWERLEMLIGPYYTRPRKGRPQMPLSVMLRIYFLQQWYGLSDPGAEEGLYDMHSMRDFVGVDLVHDVILDETTILNFCHLLETHNLTEVLFGAVSDYLEERSLLMRGGTIMDATLIAASPSTKNKSGRRDPDMSQTKKGNRKHGVVRAKVEHVFRVIKCQFGYRKVRYRGLIKNAAQMFSLMTLAKLYLARRRLLGESV